MKEQAQQFWNWFESRQSAYLFLNQLKDDVKGRLMNELLEKIQAYCPHLSFEMGAGDDGRQEMIITADGDANYFEAVNALITAAPKLDDWNFIAFVPPRGDAFEFGFEDIVLKPSDIWFLPLKDLAHPEIVAIKVCTPFYDRLKELDWLRVAVYKILENLLGEKSFALDLQYIDIGELPDTPEDQGMIQIAQLPKYIDWKKAVHLAMIYLN